MTDISLMPDLRIGQEVLVKAVVQELASPLTAGGIYTKQSFQTGTRNVLNDPKDIIALPDSDSLSEAAKTEFGMRWGDMENVADWSVQEGFVQGVLWARRYLLGEEKL